MALFDLCSWVLCFVSNEHFKYFTYNYSNIYWNYFSYFSDAGMGISKWKRRLYLIWRGDVALCRGCGLHTWSYLCLRWKHSNTNKYFNSYHQREQWFRLIGWGSYSVFVYMLLPKYDYCPGQKFLLVFPILAFLVGFLGADQANPITPPIPQLCGWLPAGLLWQNILEENNTDLVFYYPV